MTDHDEAVHLRIDALQRRLRHPERTSRTTASGADLTGQGIEEVQDVLESLRAGR